MLVQPVLADGHILVKFLASGFMARYPPDKGLRHPGTQQQRDGAPAQAVRGEAIAVPGGLCSARLASICWSTPMQPGWGYRPGPASSFGKSLNAQVQIDIADPG